jgi:hypothetical protein
VIISRLFEGKRLKFTSGFQVLVCYLAWLLVLSVISPFITGHAVPELLASKRHEFIELAQAVGAKSLVISNSFEPSWGGLLCEFPNAIFMAFLLPLPWKINSVLVLFAFIENVFTLYILGYSVYKVSRSSLYVNYTGLICFLFAVSLIMFSAISCPILGSLVRYKSPALPFLLFFFLSLFSSAKGLKSKLERNSIDS